MSKLHELNQMGQSVWYDNIQRALLDSGGMQALIDAGVVGVTSNPSIFEKAIAGSTDYDVDIQRLVAEGKSDDEIYEALVLADIGRTADLLRPVYERTNGLDGYVSLEVNPTLAHETEDTIAEARRLFGALDRPNVMIKVPATPAGVPAIETLTGDGVNVNVTLIFSLDSYEAVANAYIAGLEKRVANGEDVSRVASVASFFVSRVDTAVDKKLAQIGNKELQGQIAIANAKVAYGRFQQIFSGERWQKLADQGAMVQRPLWASTSTKNPAYPDTLYVDALIGPHTVNTVPPATLDAFRDHGAVAPTLTKNVNEAMMMLSQLGNLQISLDDVTQQLQDDGVAAFANSFHSLMRSLAEKRLKLAAEVHRLDWHLGDYQTAVDDGLAELKADEILHRIWAHDHTVWADSPEEIANRLGWLHTPDNMSQSIDEIMEFVTAVQQEDFSDVLLLGMGGSSLAPEVFNNTFGRQGAVSEDGLRLQVLDSTDADAVRHYAESLDLRRTLFVVSTKSGSTVETLSFFKYFYNQVADLAGVENAGRQFVAITDPGSKLVALAEKHSFRHTFINDPNIGGRYSVISYFGLVPAALVGADVTRLLERAHQMAGNVDSSNDPVTDNNLSAQLGVAMGVLAQAGRDKVTLIESESVSNFGDWVEQLIAESTGKNGKGILPVVGEPLVDPNVYGEDRLFVYVRLDGETAQDTAVSALAEAGQPVITIHLRDLYDLGGQFFLWEMATAIAGYRLGIHPFNQPNVESAKKRAKAMVSAYQEEGELPAGETAELSLNCLASFLEQARRGDYIALQAYVQPTPETDQALQTLRQMLLTQYGLATTLGYGPRFLHSTGQLHKGDGGNGLFIQFTSDPEEDAAIPDEAGRDDSAITFGVLKLAQALGDAQALQDEGRRLIRFHLGQDVLGGLQKLLA